MADACRFVYRLIRLIFLFCKDIFMVESYARGGSVSGCNRILAGAAGDPRPEPGVQDRPVVPHGIAGNLDRDGNRTCPGEVSLHRAGGETEDVGRDLPAIPPLA